MGEEGGRGGITGRTNYFFPYMLFSYNKFPESSATETRLDINFFSREKLSARSLRNPPFLFYDALVSIDKGGGEGQEYYWP